MFRLTVLVLMKFLSSSSLVRACPYLGRSEGAENPHGGTHGEADDIEADVMETMMEAEANASSGLRRRLQGSPPTRPTRTSRPTPAPLTSAPSPARFTGTVEQGIASAKTEIIAMMVAEPSLGVSMNVQWRRVKTE